MRAFFCSRTAPLSGCMTPALIRMMLDLPEVEEDEVGEDDEDIFEDMEFGVPKKPTTKEPPATGTKGSKGGKGTKSVSGKGSKSGKGSGKGSKSGSSSKSGKSGFYSGFFGRIRIRLSYIFIV